ncbi:glycine cleavage system aminomethyltransferase GcvT [Candidatus Uabimicrobium sp. HlEnr_7]|uniref:glycine cleavage system aminomethyltransferase GcvT n=1 Tax=Candidatus Uabimicrobium helgolandensis TaxID=3095367 RepID=UPI003555D6FB
MELKTTPLTKIHEELEAKIVPFAGFSMPIRYGNIAEEHHGVRNAAGLFDLCHMGRVTISGEEDCKYLQYLVTNNIEKMQVGQAHYALILNNEGYVLDDIIVYKRPENYMVVCNGANVDKVLEWMKKHQVSFKVDIKDDSEKIGMIAIQGATSLAVVSQLLDVDISSMKYYSCLECQIIGHSGMVARTGYTGEDGFELYLASENAPELWHKSLEIGKEQGLIPVGLAARDTLRLEAGMPLYGHEIDETTNPLEAGLRFGVKLKKGDFVGRDALLKIKEAGLKRKLVCLETEGKRIARQGSKILCGEEEVGYITSGTLSPTLGKSIAMGYVPADKALEGNIFNIKIGKNNFEFKIVKSPFYKRKK